MAQFEEKLSAILNNPQAMSQIMSIAQSLDGSKGPGEAQVPSQPPSEAQPQPTAEAAPAETTQAGLDLDPRLMAAGMQALAAWQGPEDSRTALLQALRPFLKPERHGKLDKALRITRLSKVVRAGLDGLKGGQEDV